MNGLSLPLHGDRWKNWDSAIATGLTLSHTHHHDAVLDAGACRDKSSPSAYLPGLAKLGFTNLHGCNLDEGEPVEQDNALYQFGNITKSPYITNQFAFVSCLSTIEHGVQVEDFMLEMARIIRPGGYLFVSFDYWHEPIDTAGRSAFNAPVKIFSPYDIYGMLGSADASGFDFTAKHARLKCDQKVVNWIGLDYTFGCLLWQRR